MRLKGLTRSGVWARADANLSGAIYGVITGTAVITATSGHDEPLTTVLAATVATLVVFWLAHVYAEIVAHHVSGQHRPSLALMRKATIQELPVIEAPAPSVVILLLGVLGVFSPDLAVNLALWMGIAQLTGWGVAYARQQEWPWPAAIVTGAINGGFGVAVIVLKALIH